MNKFSLILRIIWISALFLAVFCLAWLAIVPSGKITYLKDFKHYNDFIGNFTPKERVEGLKIIGDPAYFYLQTPRRFDEVKMTIKYRIDGILPDVSAGVLMNKQSGQYALQPLKGSLEDGWFTSTVDFDLHNASREKNKYGFVISIPGLFVEDNSGNALEVKEIKMELSGVSLFDKIKKFLK